MQSCLLLLPQGWRPDQSLQPPRAVFPSGEPALDIKRTSGADSSAEYIDIFKKLFKVLVNVLYKKIFNKISCLQKNFICLKKTVIPMFRKKFIIVKSAERHKSTCSFFLLLALNMLKQKVLKKKKIKRLS